MERKERTCAVCRGKYYYCPACDEDKNKPNFMFVFCSENCKDIYDVGSRFEDGRMSGETAYKELEKLDLSKQKSFGESYKETIRKILEYKPASKRVKTKKETETQDCEEVHE